jgi:hypothetical protein
MKAMISLDEMRERTGQAIFAEDWISSLTDEEYEFLREHLPVRRIVRTDGSTVRLEHVERCSAVLARKLDQTIGRRERMGAQYVTVDSWLRDHGLLGAGTPTAAIECNQLFDVPPAPASRLDGTEDRERFNKVVRELQQSEQAAQPLGRRQRGPKRQTRQRVVREMWADLAQELSREELANMSELKMAEKYGASRETVCKART